MTPTRQIVKAVIPVAGMGTRLLPATKSQPKEMLPVGRRPVVQYVVEEMEAAGLDQILFVTGRKKTAIEDHFDADPELVRLLSAGDSYTLLEELEYTETDATFFYTRQSTPLGLADAVRHAEKFVGDEHFVVSLGDSIITNADGASFVSRLVEAHLASGAGCTIALEQVSPDDAYRYGIVEPVAGADLSGPFEIESLVEKPAYGAASITAEAMHFVDVPEDKIALVQTGSWIDLEGERIWGSDIDVDGLYEP